MMLTSPAAVRADFGYIGVGWWRMTVSKLHGCIAGIAFRSRFHFGYNTLFQWQHRRQVTRARKMYRYKGRWKNSNAYDYKRTTGWMCTVGLNRRRMTCCESYEPLYRGTSGWSSPTWLLVTLADSMWCWNGFEEADSSRESRSNSVLIIVLSCRSCKLMADNVDRGWRETPGSFSRRLVSVNPINTSINKPTKKQQGEIKRWLKNIHETKEIRPIWSTCLNV